MKAIILVGGEGTRLRPLTYITPKAMMPVLNIPFIHHVLNYLKKHGVDQVVLSMGYKPDPIQKYFESNRVQGLEIIYNIENSPLGTAGAVKFAQKYIEPGETFFVLNGDIFTDTDLTKMLQQHHRNKARVTIALTAVEDPSMFGVVEMGNKNRVLRFIEKPKKEEAPSNLINAGIYLMHSSVLDRIPENKFFMFEHSVFPQMVSEKEPVSGFISESYWIDMGNPQKYRQLNCDLLSGKCFPAGEGALESQGLCTVDASAKISKSATIDKSAVGRDCDIGEGCLIDNSAVGPGCKIGKECRIEKSITWADVKIGKGARIKNSIIAGRCIIEDNAIIEDRVVTKE